MARRGNPQQVLTSEVESVSLSFYTDEEVRSTSVMEITTPLLFDNLERPIPGGLFDPALGPWKEDLGSCKTCGEPCAHCPGHCGHINLVLPVYNPLLFRTLLKLLRQTCFYCHHLLMDRKRVEILTTKLELIMKGDIIQARNIDSLGIDSADSSEKNEFYVAESTKQGPQTSLLTEKNSWVSLQYSESKSVFKAIITDGNGRKCGNCSAKNPKIVSPDFGLLYKEALSADAIASNFMRASKPDLTFGHAQDQKSEPSGEGVSDGSLNGPKNKKSSSQKNQVKDLPPEFATQKDHFGTRTHLSPLQPQNILLGKILQCNMNLADGLKQQDSNTGPSINLDNANQWRLLQEAVNVLFDSSKATSRREKTIKGISQILEKKEGIFRQNMMGKRVNFACRSVISPDPYLAVNEIGIPPYFALRLTYPEKVTPWNADRLRKAIMNGPNVFPGALRVEDEQGITRLEHPAVRRAMAKKLCSSSGVSGLYNGTGFEEKVVHRHLQDGDVLLVNRQPTLHKPSMMAHVARVLKGEKTLRMHYANCSAYNADFDGDEMNVHFPQDEIARAEAYNIVNANEQYIVPTKGEPIRGLIQDHVASSVLLTKKDTFLTRDEYQHLLYNACILASAPAYQVENNCKFYTIGVEEDIHTISPAIWKPCPLWTGKQVVTTILNHITRGRPPFTVENEGKMQDHNIIPKGSEGDANTLHRKCLISRNEFLYGVIDKAQYGKYGLIHVVQELYGSHTAGNLLSILSRLFTAHLQMHGFTCGLDDLLLVPKAGSLKSECLDKCERIGESVHSKFVGAEDGKLDPMSLQREIENVLRVDGESATERLDALMSSELNELTNELNKKLFPGCLMKAFPSNCVFLMTASGAKGSNVNFIQISSLLGQQELEGKRVPRLVSGKTLPCFPPWDTSPRAGGFISDRFLTGLRPQEYYFHCMAGRDGLVDTAVKTSRSGYLQRCLIKNLECLKVNYDYTVRDADGSVVQFYYGEDGIDVTKSSCLTEFKILATNQEILQERLENHPSSYTGGTGFDGYINDMPDLLKKKAERFVREIPDDQKKTLKLRKDKRFMRLVKLKYLSSLAHAGEAVGVVAAQSIGEPSTQMTLNTFHLAGRGEGNVTLGMPRLREILMTASKNILTPLVTCPLLHHKSRSDAERIAATLKRIRFSDVVQSMEVCVVPFAVETRVVSTLYKLKVHLCKPDMYPKHMNITEEECEDTFENKFVPKLKKEVNRYLKKLKGAQAGVEVVQSAPEGQSVAKTNGENEDASQPSEKGEREEEVDIDKDANDEDEDDTDGSDEDDVEYDDDEEREMSEVEDLSTDEDVDGDSKMQDKIPPVVDSPSTPRESYSKRFNTSELTPESKYTAKDAKSRRGIFSTTELTSESKTSAKGLGVKREKSTKTDARIIVAAGSCLEVHFSVPKGTYFLLSQIAEKVAMGVYIRTVEGIDNCTIIMPKGYSSQSNNQVLSGSKNKKHSKVRPADLDKKIEPIKLQTRGVNFMALWRLQDEMDIRKLCSNDIHAMLNKYGVEAARSTIVTEVRGVFERYGIRPDIRHLSLIADFMTFEGQFRPMNRHGISSSTSPFLRITFETATNFVVDMAAHGDVEPLESPSARIAMGQPVKLGTGCFDLLQKLHV